MCAKCGITRESFKNFKTFWQHSCLGSTILCDVCQFSFSSEQVLKVHTMSVHLQEEIKCSLCDKVFTTRQALHRQFSRKERKDVHVFNCTNSQPTDKPQNKDSNFFIVINAIKHIQEKK